MGYVQETAAGPGKKTFAGTVEAVKIRGRISAEIELPTGGESMVLETFYNGLEIHREEKIVYARFLEPHLVLSTCRAAGGMQDDMAYIFNHQSCEPTGHHGSLPSGVISDPAGYRGFIAGQYDLPAEKCATLGTAANMNNAVIARESFRDLTVVAVCTGGVETNGGRVGDPASYYECETGFEQVPDREEAPEHGTINTMVFISKELTPGAMVRVVMTATEAKTAVLQELAVNSRYSDGLATGTGTDQIAVASCRGTGKPLTSAGKHAKLGELIGKAVYRAIKKTLALQNSLTPQGQCSAKTHLERFGADREIMIREMARDPLPEKEQKLLSDNFIAMERDPMVVAAVAALVHLRDKIAWGVLPLECRPEIMVNYGAQLASAVSGKQDRLPFYREMLSLFGVASDNEGFVKMVCRAMALGFSDKWVRVFESGERRDAAERVMVVEEG